MGRRDQACVNFRLGDEGFGIPLCQVREVACAGAVVPVPLAPPVIRGLANIQGRVVTLIDVGGIFGLPLPPARTVADRLALVLAAPFEHLALYVHAPVEISRAKATLEMRAGMVQVAAVSGDASARTAGAPPEETDALNLLSARDIVARCEATIVEGFRRRI